MTCPKCGGRRMSTVWRGDYEIDRCLDCPTTITRRVPGHRPIQGPPDPWSLKFIEIMAECYRNRTLRGGPVLRAMLAMAEQGG